MTRDSARITDQTALVDLIRHGEPAGGARFRGSIDDPLSPEGWQQMRGAIGGADGWDQVVSSPLLRCRQFAEEMAARFDLPLHVEPELREIHFGDWEGFTAAEIAESHGTHLERFWSDPKNNPPPRGETIEAFHQRVSEAFTRWQSDLTGKRTLMVCHGGTIRMILADILEMPLSRSFAAFAAPYACRSRIRIDRTEHGTLRSLLQHGTLSP